MRPATIRRPAGLVGVGLACTVALVGCSTDITPVTGSASASPAVNVSASPTEVAAPQLIPQPDVGDLEVAPDADRVDLEIPTFSNPTVIDNPLFPVSQQASVLLLGTVDDQPFRTEVTLLPWTRVITWQDRQIPTLVSQYVAFLGGRIHEVAYDYYAQADDGSVWYFGEDVFNFADGAIVDTHGTWIAGIDGPAAMIMPGSPQVGDVYRPENIPGFVFEEVTVKAVDQPLDGPLGSIDGGLQIEELHMDGQTEDKSFAPGYGEFYTAGGGDVEALAMAVPADAAGGPMPAELGTLNRGWADAFQAAGRGRWQVASAAVAEMSAAWRTLRGGDIPRLVEPTMNDAMQALADAVQSRQPGAAQQAAIGAAQSILDLQLRFVPTAEVDLARFELWAAQLLADLAAEDDGAISGDVFTLDYIRDRVLQALNDAGRTAMNSALEELQTAISDGDVDAAAEIATRLRSVSR